jgi:hypothetical protein
MTFQHARRPTESAAGAHREPPSKRRKPTWDKISEFQPARLTDAAPPSKFGGHRGDQHHSGPRAPHGVIADTRAEPLPPTWDQISEFVGRLVKDERAARERAVAQMTAEIHVLKASAPSQFPAAPAPVTAESTPRPLRPAPDHPLSQFFEERLVLRSWLKTPCGKVASAYRKWYQGKVAAGETLPPKLNHISFVAAFKGFAERTGCESRRMWAGVGLAPTGDALPFSAPQTTAGTELSDGAVSGSESEASSEYSNGDSVYKRACTTTPVDAAPPQLK